MTDILEERNNRLGKGNKKKCEREGKGATKTLSKFVFIDTHGEEDLDAQK